MAQILMSVLILICVLIKNYSVAVAATLVLLASLLQMTQILYWFDNHTIPLGIMILTLGVLSPLMDGRITNEQIIGIAKNPTALLAVVVGVVVSALGGRGVPFMREQPLVVSGLLFGTLIGVLLFDGIPVGPLIAAGVTVVLANLFGLAGR